MQVLVLTLLPFLIILFILQEWAQPSNILLPFIGLRWVLPATKWTSWSTDTSKNQVRLLNTIPATIAGFCLESGSGTLTISKHKTNTQHAIFVLSMLSLIKIFIFSFADSGSKWTGPSLSVMWAPFLWDANMLFTVQINYPNSRRSVLLLFTETAAGAIWQNASS